MSDAGAAHVDRAYTLEDPELDEIDARPTKELFIEMLTKDITLTAAINDLVDNSTDGAKRMRAGGKFKGLWIHITLNEDMLEITDNCGGLEADIARHYAFRFGRPRGSKKLADGSVGLFGVGMKRAFFKMGSFFRVESNAEKSSFLLEVDVDAWTENANHWAFPFVEDLPRSNRLGGVKGTSIIVKDLNSSVKQDFTDPIFIKELSHSIRQAQQAAIFSELEIRLNGTHMIADVPKIISSSDIQPVYINEDIEFTDKPPVHKKIYVGLGKSSRGKAGWSIYCNGRLIVDADKSSTTGWGASSLTARIPEYHNQFAKFRGYVFLDSDDPSALPYNTTKSGIDSEAPIFKSLRSEMIDVARPVFDFLNELKEASENSTTVPSIEMAVQQAREVTLDAISERREFARPLIDASSPSNKRISFTRPTELVDEVMEIMEVTSTKAVGERAFDYYYEAECSQ